MIGADLVTAAVLITFGVLYGFTSPTQLIIICLIEPLAMKINEHIVVHFLHVSSNHGYHSYHDNQSVTMTVSDDHLCLMM